MFDRPPARRLAAFVIFATLSGTAARAQPPATGSTPLTEATCMSAALAAAVPADRIGEPVSAVVLDSPSWVAPTQETPAHCLVSGRLVGRTRVVQLSPTYFARDELRSYLERLAEAERDLRDRVESLRRRPRRAGKPL